MDRLQPLEMVGVEHSTLWSPAEPACCQYVSILLAAFTLSKTTDFGWVSTAALRMTTAADHSHWLLGAARMAVLLTGLKPFGVLHVFVVSKFIQPEGCEDTCCHATTS
jgi:hypothetical protein